MPSSPSAAKAQGVVTRKVGPLPLWTWALALAAAYLLYRRYKSSSGAGFADVPAVNSTDASTAQTPSGGGGSSAENLNDPLMNLVGRVQDPVTQQVQTTSAASTSAPTMYSYINQSEAAYLQTTPTFGTNAGIGGGYIQTGAGGQLITYAPSSPGSDYYAGTPTSETGSNIRKPGAQI